MLPLGEPVTILRRVQTGTDRYGKPVYDWPEPGVEVPRCAVSPRMSEEPAQVGREQVITGLTVYLPPGTEIEPYDRLRVRGRVYEVVGEPGEWRNPYSGRSVGVQVAIKRVEG